MKNINFTRAAIINFISLISLLNSAQLIAKSNSASSCVAHRGYSYKHLENSIEAILAAQAVGAHGIEFDVVHTKDGIPLVHHDETPYRTARSKKGKNCKLDTPFAQQYFAQLRENCELQNGEEIPSLEEVFNVMQDKPATLFVELKDSPSEQTLDLLNIDFHNKVVISYSSNDLDRVAQVHDEIPLILVTDHPVPVPDRFDGIGTQSLSDAQLRTLHSKGKIANIWTVNDSASMHALANQGIDYITTDKIELCLDEVGK